MLLVDSDIRELIRDKILDPRDIPEEEVQNSVHSVHYDLHTEYFAISETAQLPKYDLNPGESVFVGCCEQIKLSDDLVARIILRNSRIRQGLSLEAPLYQPGHHSLVFFRITNVSHNVISLDTNNGIAAITFERLDHAPQTSYDGVFQEELSFQNMGSYAKQYRLEMTELEEKADSIKHLERNIYSNIITLMTIFIALFSLINVNIDLAYAKEIERQRMIVFNLTTIGSIAFLVSMIQMCFAHKKGFWMVTLLLISLIILGVAVCVAL